MSTYSDHWNDHSPRATALIHEDQPSAKVTYRDENGRRFAVIVRQKPNPIGFRASLPGDKRTR